MLETKEYIYSRIKNEFVNDKGELELFLFATLTLVILKPTSEDTNRKKVTPVCSKLVEILVKNAPAAYVELRDHDLRLVIDKDEFERLEALYVHEVDAFLLYKPSVELLSQQETISPQEFFFYKESKNEE